MADSRLWCILQRLAVFTLLLVHFSSKLINYFSLQTSIWVFQKYFDVREMWDVKDTVSTYVCTKGIYSCGVNCTYMNVKYQDISIFSRFGERTSQRVRWPSLYQNRVLIFFLPFLKGHFFLLHQALLQGHKRQKVQHSRNKRLLGPPDAGVAAKPMNLLDR